MITQVIASDAPDGNQRRKRDQSNEKGRAIATREQRDVYPNVVAAVGERNRCHGENRRRAWFHFCELIFTSFPVDEFLDADCDWRQTEPTDPRVRNNKASEITDKANSDQTRKSQVLTGYDVPAS